MQLEKDGETTNMYSDSKTGSYAKYRLTNARRVRGEDPTKLQEGQGVEVTVVIQQEKKGVVDKTVDILEPTSERVRDAVNGIIGDASSDSTSSDSHSSSDDAGAESGRSALSGGRGIMSDTPEVSDSPSTSSKSSTGTAIQPSVGSRVNTGLRK